MHQWSSRSIARVASALAKAQAELTNPEKTLTATINPPAGSAGENGEGGGRTFRYASLASGLEIVRKVLSRHGIAAVQCTAIDAAAQLIKLTTVLAHSSGEWIAADWPVCAVNETEVPHRMGAALTYARRYALFTLVGIAGEDDLDAPDLQTSAPRTPRTQSGKGATNGVNTGNGRFSFAHGVPARKTTKTIGASRRTSLSPEQSAAMRDRFLGELNAIASADDGALWAHCNLRAKNGLTAADAQAVETAFQEKLSSFAAPEGAAKRGVGAGKGSSVLSRGGVQRSGSPAKKRLRKTGKDHSQAIDKTVLAFPEPRRIRDREHVRLVAKQPCLVCGRMPCDPHHLRYVQSRALGRKVSDEFTIPLCRGHHREVHRCGEEAAWWQKIGIDPIPAARALWLQNHPLPSNDYLPASNSD